MTNIEIAHPIGELQALLDEHGVAAPADTVARSSELGLELGVTKFYGAELVLPAGAAGRLVVRQVEQLPHPYIAGLPYDHPEVSNFNGSKMSGVLADVRVYSVSPSHLLVARKSVLSVRNPIGAANMQAGKRFVAGRAADTGGLLDFDMSGLAMTRLLKPSEMGYSEPSIATMIFAAIKRKR